MHYRLLRLVVAVLIAAGTLVVPKSLYFMWVVETTFLVGLAVFVSPEDGRWVVTATLLALPMLRLVPGYLLYTNLFWYVVFVPVVALVCTVITEWWVRESEDDDRNQSSNR